MPPKTRSRRARPTIIHSGRTPSLADDVAKEQQCPEPPVKNSHRDPELELIPGDIADLDSSNDEDEEDHEIKKQPLTWQQAKEMVTAFHQMQNAQMVLMWNVQLHSSIDDSEVTEPLPLSILFISLFANSDKSYPAFPVSTLNVVQKDALFSSLDSSLAVTTKTRTRRSNSSLLTSTIREKYSSWVSWLPKYNCADDWVLDYINRKRTPKLD
ncbi:hypothetical protein P9112_009990 [Eukaryota sp. TZLM1-RC]